MPMERYTELRAVFRDATY